MASTFLDGRLRIVVDDITTLDVDMVTNAANGALCGGGGVDGAIHRAAGPELLAECRTLGGAAPGEVKVTAGYSLPARFIAHAVGPVWAGGDNGEEGQLRACYVSALEHLASRNLGSIAFPSISTGAFRFPLPRAAAIAVDAIVEALEARAETQVVMCCFSDADARVYERAARGRLQPRLL